MLPAKKKFSNALFCIKIYVILGLVILVVSDKQGGLVIFKTAEIWRHLFI